MPGLLEGVKVIDLTRHIAGPYCTKLFATLGADVIKIEHPTSGDPARSMPPFAPAASPEQKQETSAWFLYLNTSKQSMTLNLKSARGRDIFLNLARSADVLVENFSPGALDKLGIGYDKLRQINPSLVVTSISDYGQTGPYRDWLAEEINLYAAGGLMNITGESEQEPLKEGAPLAQLGAGQNAFVATMTGLHYAEDTGVGQHMTFPLPSIAQISWKTP